MVQKIITTNISISELKPIIEKQINSIKGRIISTENNSIKWDYKYGKNQLEVIAKFKQINHRTEINIISTNIEGKSLGEGISITNFLKSLSDELIFEEIKEKPKTNIKDNIHTQNKNHQKGFNYKPILFGIAILFFLYFIGNNNNDTSTTIRTTAQGFKASYNEESLSNLVQYSVDKDYQAIEYLLNSGEVFELPAGQEAYIIESKLGRVKIRLKGETNELWTFSEAIK
jgi:hypothetical protein